MLVLIIDKLLIVDCVFVDKFMVLVDWLFDYGVYFFFYDWWEGVMIEVIDVYMEELYNIFGVLDFLVEGYIVELLIVEGLCEYGFGMFGVVYCDFVEENNLIENFGWDYCVF